MKEKTAGQKLAVFLADGSKLVLNASSMISLTKPFHPHKGEVLLEGEAFFEVAKDALRPFQVVSSELTTTALGTSFNIVAYPQDVLIQVSLATGKVKVDFHKAALKSPYEIIYLKSGKQMAYLKIQQVLTKELFNADKVLVWKDGAIYLENVDQASVIKKLKRWYGIKIQVEGKSSTAGNVITTFKNQSLKSVLTSLGFTLGFAFEIREDCIFIKHS